MTESVFHPSGAPPPDDWRNLGDLVRHIVHAHHHYVRRALPEITAGLNDLATRHGAVHPHLHQVRQTFAALGDALLMHMEKEEHILFPYITELAGSIGRLPPSPFGTIANPVRMMEDDHEDALAHLAELRTLTNSFTAPPEWAPGDAAPYIALARFGADLQQHIHLENTVLFPGALDLEVRLT